MLDSVFSQNSRAQWIMVGVLMLVAFGLRLETITSPPLEFEPTRQYKSYIITRGFYFDGDDSLPEWQRHVADLNLQSEERLEPPIMEAIMAIAFDFAGREVIWLPRLVSSIFWLIGGVFLFLIY